MNAELVETAEGLLFVGELEPAKQALIETYGAENVVESGPDEHGFYTVAERAGILPDADLGGFPGGQWGRGHSLEEAWRYLIGIDISLES